MHTPATYKEYFLSLVVQPRHTVRMPSTTRQGWRNPSRAFYMRRSSALKEASSPRQKPRKARGIMSNAQNINCIGQACLLIKSSGRPPPATKRKPRPGVFSECSFAHQACRGLQNGHAWQKTLLWSILIPRRVAAKAKHASNYIHSSTHTHERLTANTRSLTERRHSILLCTARTALEPHPRHSEGHL